MTNHYDLVASRYDESYRRTIDVVEDEIMGDFFRPVCDGANILDLGCGTGLLRRLTNPELYAGVDNSDGMLNRLTNRHQECYVVYGDLTNADSRQSIIETLAPVAPFDAIVSLWSAHYFHSPELLADFLPLLNAGGRVILHGSLPLNEKRDHYILNGARHDHLNFIPEQVMQDFRSAGLEQVSTTGFNMVPDKLAGHLPKPLLSRLMRLSQRFPTRYSYHGAISGRWKPDTPTNGVSHA